MVQMDTPKGFNIHPKKYKTAQDQKNFSNPLSWRLYKGRVKSRQNQRPRWARGRPAGLATAAIGQTQLSTDSRKGSEPLSERRRPRGGNPRPAGQGEASRPLSSPSWPSVLPKSHSSFVHSPGKWVLELLFILGCLVGLWINVNAFR